MASRPYGRAPPRGQDATAETRQKEKEIPVIKPRLLFSGLGVFVLLASVACGPGGGDGGDGGSSLRTLGAEGTFVSSPRFSPDGQTLAFARAVNDAHEIALIGVDGSGLRQLAPAGTYLAATAWRADGSGVVFSSDAGIDEAAISGGTVTHLVDDFATLDPDLSADGAFLVYGINGGAMQWVELATGASRVLASAGNSPRFSPDGTKIAFESGDQIHILTLADDSIKQVVETNTYLASVDWFSDGQRLVVSSDQGIEVVDLGTSPVTRTVIDDAFAAHYVDLSPDEKTVAYAVNGSTSIYLRSGF